MARFLLTAQLQLAAPTNVGSVVRQIQSQLNGVNVNVGVRGATSATKQMNSLSKSTNQAASSAERLGSSFAKSIKRFAAFSIATRMVSLITQGLGGAVAEAIQFERELIKVAQVTGKTMRELKGLSNTVRDLSTSLGVSSKELLSVARILAQTGLSARETEIALSALAKTELAPTFENITQTAEGAVAIINQFKQGVEALEAQLGSINAVAGQFAVEAGDLIAVIRRTGGVFKSAGGDLNELIALFTSVRATTRESAESIATGLRTIFTRIQRPKTIEFLKEMGVELLDLEGRFVGPYEAVRRLNAALIGLKPGDLKFIEIAEQLGGFRQIGKVLPLLQEFTVAEQARAAALAGTNSLTDDAATAQQALTVRVTALKEQFLELMAAIVGSPTFMIMANAAIALAENLMKIADALKHLIPLLVTLAAIKLTQGMMGFMGGMKGGMASGGAMKFARGGLVPGSGNRDTVPAVLTPGEFVIRKQSVSAIGTDRLQQMNRYAAGGKVSARRNYYGGIRDYGVAVLGDPDKNRSRSFSIGKNSGDVNLANGSAFTDARVLGFVTKAMKRHKLEKQKVLSILATETTKQGTSGMLTHSGPTDPTLLQNFRTSINEGLIEGIDHGSSQLSKRFPGVAARKTPPAQAEQVLAGLNNAAVGNAFEAILDNLSGEPYDQKQDPKRPFDFVTGLGNMASMFPSLSGKKYVEAKGSWQAAEWAGIRGKIINQAGLNAATSPGIRGALSAAGARKGTAMAGVAGGKPPAAAGGGAAGAAIGKAKGGGVYGTDTVPALLTPGEFVVNKRSAQSIGYAKLSEMNRYAAGGKVSAGRHAYGPMDTIGAGMAPQGAAAPAAKVDTSAIDKALKTTAGFFTNPLDTNLKKSAGLFLTPLNANIEKTAALMLGDFTLAFNDIAALLEGAFRTAILATEKPLQGLVTEAAAVGTVLNTTFRQGAINAARGMFRVGRAGDSALKGINAIGTAASGLKTQMSNVATQMKTAGSSTAGLKGMAEAAPLVATALRQLAEFAPLAATAIQNLRTAAAETVAVFNPMLFEAGSALAGAFNTFAGNINSIGTALNKFKTALNKTGGATKKSKGGNQEQATQKFVAVLGEAIVAAQLFATTMAQLTGLLTAAMAPLAQVMVSMGLLSQTEVDAAMDVNKLGNVAIDTAADLVNTGNSANKAGMGMMAMLGPLMAVEMLLGMFGSKLDEVDSTMGRLGSAMVKGVSIFVMLVMIASMLGVEKLGEVMATKASIDATGVEIMSRWGNIKAMMAEKMSMAMGATIFIAAILAGAIAIYSFVTAMRDAAIEAAKTAVEEGEMSGEEFGKKKRSEEKKAMTGFGIGLMVLTGVLYFIAGAIATAFGVALAPVFAIVAIVVAIIAGLIALINMFDGFRDAMSFLTFGLMDTAEELAAVAHMEGMVLEAEKKSKDAKETNTKVLKDLSEGTISAAEAMRQFSRAGIASAAAVVAARERMIKSQKTDLTSISGMLSAAGRQFFSMVTFGMVESNQKRDARIDDENAGDLAKEQGILLSEMKAMNPILAAQAKNMILADSGAATSRDKFMNKAQVAAGPEFHKLNDDQQKQMRTDWENMFDNLQKEISKNIAKYKAMNFQLRASESAINLATIRMAEFTSSLEVGFLPLENSLNTLTSVLENSASAITDAEIDAAIKDVTDAMHSFGGDRKRLDIFGETIKGFNSVTQHFEKNADKITNKLKQGGENFNLEKVEEMYKEEMEKSLKAAGIGKKARKRIMDTVELTDKQKERLATGDKNVLEELTEEQRENVQKQLEQVAKIVELQKVVVDLTKQKVKMERKALAAEKKAIDLRLEAANIIAKHGGKAVTGADRRKAVLDKANVGAGKMGLSSMGTGSIAEVRQRNAQIMGNFAGAETGGRRVGGVGGFEGPAGVEGAGRRDDLMKAQQDHIKMIKDLIKVEEEELKLIEKKNELEKKSMEQLLKGDLEGFLKDQAAVGATAAVATGSAGLMGLFGAEALGGAFTNIQSQANAGQGSLFGQQLQGGGGLMERAGGAALSARGMGGDRAAQMLAGTGAEAEAKRKNIRGLAGELGAAGQTGVDMAQMQVNTAKLNIREARIIVNKAITDAGTPGVINKAAGGLIYASKGMFVPRGSDTVPAMLTPGEFIVNRAAVNRGNNLQLLRAMNGTARGYAEGGPVGYYSRGSRDRVRGGGVGMDAAAMQSFTTALNSFNSNLTDNLDRLERSKISIKLDATSVTVKLDGGNFLASMRDELKRELLAEISNQMGNQSFNLAGEPTYDPSLTS
jgi:TP901 family phage tail tape measure protein